MRLSSCLNNDNWAEYGVNYRISYGTASLEHYVNASLVMYPYNKNNFIMTDDPKRLEQALLDFHEKIQEGSTASPSSSYTAETKDLFLIIYPNIHLNLIQMRIFGLQFK